LKALSWRRRLAFISVVVFKFFHQPQHLVFIS